MPVSSERSELIFNFLSEEEEKEILSKVKERVRKKQRKIGISQRNKIREANSKLTQPEVIEIRKEASSSLKELATKYNVSMATISDIRNFRRFENW